MSEIIKQSMADIWASIGDVVAPDVGKIAEGWLIEVVPHQYWNWMQNRTDTNLAYLFQHGIPEWDATVEYIVNKSYVAYADVVYKAILTGTNKIPSSQPTYWKVAFATSTDALEALKATTPAADKLPYFSGTTTATTTTLTPLARSLLDDTTQAAMLTTIGAQPVDATLTALAGVTTATNKLPYFTGVDTATVTDLSAFGRSLIDDVDAASARSTLNVYSTLEVDSALNLKQPLDTTLTALAGLATANNTIAYFTATDVATTTTLTPFARSLLDDVDATATRTTIGLNNVNNTSDATKPVSAAQQAALDSKLSLSGGTLTGRLYGTSCGMVGTGNDYSSGAYEVVGNGASNTVFPTIGFHQPNLYAASLQLRGAADFRFYAQGAADYANVTANIFYGTLAGNASSATTLTGLTSSVAELNYVAGVTSSIQTQLNAKAPLASPALSGTPTAPTATLGTNTTQLATTAFVLANGGGIGAGQTWQGVAASRALGVTYTNTTGRTIAVSGYLLNTGGAVTSTVVGGIVVSNFVAAAAAPAMPFSAIVPNGDTYSLSLTSGSATITCWTELR